MQCVKETDCTAAGKESGDCAPAEHNENGGHFDTAAEEINQVERPEHLEVEAPSEEAVAQLCLIFARTALQPVTIGAKKKVGNIITLNSDAQF